MRLAIEFDHDLRVVREEIGDEGAEGRLPPELDAALLTIVEPVPKRPRGRRHSFA